MKNIAIIGAGLSGLSLAHLLKNEANITIFEKSRGAGGRISTRYAGEFQFDHGAQYFTVKSEAFREFLGQLFEDKVVESWETKFANMNLAETMQISEWSDDYPHYIGVPKMNGIGKALARDINVKYQIRVDKLECEHGKWNLIDVEQREYGNFDWVISAIPAEQTSQLMPEMFLHKSKISLVKMHPCFALMIGLRQEIELPWQAAIVKNSAISWIAVNSKKQGRPDGFSLLVHSTNSWAEAHVNDALGPVKSYLLGELEKIINHDFSDAVHIDVHRWLYANSDKQEQPLVLIDDNNQLAACGDWCVHGRVEGAFLSAYNIAEQLRDQLN